MIASPIIGHRGCARRAPENSLAAMTFSRDIGLDWVEIDANLLGDGTAVMFHDSTLNRLTPAKGKLTKQTWATVKDLDVGSHFSADFQAERLPSLEQALIHIRDLGLGLNLEIKHYPDVSIEHITDACIAALDQHWRDFDRLLLSSFNGEILARLHQARPNWLLGHLWERLPDNWLEVARILDLASVNLDHKTLTQAQAEAIKTAGYDLYCYTVNDRAAAVRLWDWGVDGVFTDDPALISPAP
ncbi:glycerophosphodiester phosphodiesterase family protein [Saccharospirillum mangrovi]|uniref:glycerophosphodiester phosphodiesterase family protein n=1 Tax=Saccharospirillum mangrovi TaxID=2161747 RepID=UPI000D37D336|nr:glycerophosphodiester phosphodiesterase family protein [Saccharospirillum mangrovi]